MIGAGGWPRCRQQIRRKQRAASGTHRLLEAPACGKQSLLAVARADQLDARRDWSRFPPRHRDGQRERGDTGRVSPAR